MIVWLIFGSVHFCSLHGCERGPIKTVDDFLASVMGSSCLSKLQEMPGLDLEQSALEGAARVSDVEEAERGRSDRGARRGDPSRVSDAHVAACGPERASHRGSPGLDRGGSVAARALQPAEDVDEERLEVGHARPPVRL